MPEPVLVPADPSSVYYHALDCRMFDRRRAAQLAREDAEDVLGRRPAPCLRAAGVGPDPDDDGRREVPA